MVRPHEATRVPRVLLVTDDERFSARLKRGLPGVELLSVTQDLVWLAMRADLDVTRGISTLAIDSTVEGLQQLRLYERLRPPEAESQVPIVFTRARLVRPAVPSHELDFSQPADGSAEEAARLIVHALGMPFMTARAAAQPGASDTRARQRQGAQHAPAVPAGLLRRLGLWSIAAALIGFTVWPIVGSGPVRAAVQAPLAAFTS